MLQSMTGFGFVQKETESQTIVIEIKTLNSKFTDIYCRIPKNLSLREIDLRNILQKELERGKMDLSITLFPKDESAATQLNKAVVKAYFNGLMETGKELGFEPDPTELITLAAKLPNAFINATLPSENEEDQSWIDIKEAVYEAVIKCKEFRIQEGKTTKIKFIEYIKTIDSLLEEVKEQDQNRINNVKVRLNKAISDFVNSENFDKNRFEQELIYYIEKFDISEEKVRLKAHLNYFLGELEKDSNGKKLNFISQEIGREINTIGSKANDAVIQRLVVQMKDELEKIKEQTSNIL